MTLILILSGVLLCTGSLLYAWHKISGGDKTDSPAGDSRPSDAETGINDDRKAPFLSHRRAEQAGICCGMHTVCEKFPDASSTTQPLYYDDEELDAYAGRTADEYTETEADMFREVMLTMLPSDYIGWETSLRQRGITMPAEIREELMMLISENLIKIPPNSQTTHSPTSTHGFDTKL